MRHAFLRPTFFVLAALYLAATVFGGIGLGWMAVHPGTRPLTALDERKAEATAHAENAELQDVQIVSPDGIPLRAWFVQPTQANGSVVMLLHGVSDNRLGMRGYGDWLVSNHYSVLLPDARAHGLSGGGTRNGRIRRHPSMGKLDRAECSPALCVQLG